MPNRQNHQFAVSELNQVWFGDVTYISSVQRWSNPVAIIHILVPKAFGRASSNSSDSALFTKVLSTAR